MPAELVKTTDQKLDERSDEVLDGLFGDVVDPPPVKEEKKETPPAKKVEEKPEEEEEEEDEDKSDDSDTDWEEEDKKEEEKPDDDEVPPANESEARKQAKEKGREAKQLKTQLTERQLELEKIREEKKALEERLELVESTKTRPEDTPEFQERHEAVMSDVRAVARRLPVKSRMLLTPNFGAIMVSYMDSLEAPLETSDESDKALMETIVDKLSLSEIPFADLDDDEREALRPQVDKVMDLLERNLEKTKDLQKLHTTLKEKSKTGHLSIGVRQYMAAVDELKPILDSVGDLSDEMIDTDPYAVASVVAKLVKSSPEGKRRLEAAKKEVLEVLIGPPALTQDEIDKLHNNGTDVKEFMRERDKRQNALKKKLAPLFVQALMSRAHFKTSLAKLAKLEIDKSSEESEFDALQEVTKKRASGEPKKKVKASERDPLADLLGEE